VQWFNGKLPASGSSVGIIAGIGYHLSRCIRRPLSIGIELP
jgi:hypothetical protein